MVRKKRELYSRKVRGWEQKWGRGRLAEVTRLTSNRSLRKHWEMPMPMTKDLVFKEVREMFMKVSWHAAGMSSATFTTRPSS
jgi:hypothetical protein